MIADGNMSTIQLYPKSLPKENKEISNPWSTKWKTGALRKVQARSQDFFCGEGGGCVLQVKSRQSRLIWDAWTLCKDFWGVPGDISPEKINNLRSSNCWKCTEMVNLTITVLFLYHFKYFTIPSGGPFWFLGGGGFVRTPRTPPCLRACGMKLNRPKCKDLIISFAKECPELDRIFIQDYELTPVSSVKILGVHVSSDLK